MDRGIYNILETDSPDALLNEVEIILNMISPDFNPEPVIFAFHSTICLYEGTYPGYRACNTRYHDIDHTITTFLAMARLIHGAILDGEALSDRYIVLGLIAALFHDAGYIQEKHDRQGTGAKYTSSHVRRSMDFLKRHGAAHGLSEDEIAAGQIIIYCTDIMADIFVIDFPCHEAELLGKILAVADVMAQMADRIYLEKLLFLYHEFREGKIEGFESEVDLLQKTLGFYDFIASRLEKLFNRIDKFLKLHFSARWQICENLYFTAIIKHRRYLKQIMKLPEPLKYLKRAGVVDEVCKTYGEIQNDPE